MTLFHELLSKRISRNKYNEYEYKRSKMFHYLTKQSWGAHFISPIEQGLKKGKDFKVLDVGCGSAAIWLLTLSKKYPSTKFVGVDKSSTFPKNFSQNNLEFKKGDIIKGLPFKNNTFDFVHMRFLLNYFTEIQWENIINELVRVCKPGGWIEILDYEEIKFLGPNLKRLMVSSKNYLDQLGICDNVNTLEETPGLFEATDQIDKIYEDERIFSLNKCGRSSLEYFIKALHQTTNWTLINENEYEKMADLLLKEVEHYRPYLITCKIYCQKNLL